ncbi:hypothetical protein PWT90_04403 [Aphanocladium album]|nr:hypothetical protein PWT90_04403 [Aphanocladium album]
MASQVKPHRTIREHKKSRLGCSTCKRRKVKCDLGRPVCGACRLRRTVCQYPENHQISESARAGVPSDSAATNNGVQDHRDVLFDELDAVLPASTTTDMRYLWFFTAHTSKSLLAEQYDTTGFGSTVQTLVVQEALEHPFLLKTLFVIAGLHMRHLNQDVDPGIVHRYRAESLQGYRQAIQNANPATFAALLANSILIAAPSCGSFRDPNSPDLYILDWIVLWQGIRCIHGLFEDVPKQSSGGIKTLLVRPTLVMDDADAFIPVRLQNLVYKVDTGDPDLSNIATYQTALSYLGSLYKSLHQANQASTALLIVTWITFLPESFINAARNQKHRALVILAHYSAFFKILQNMWWIEGTADRCIRDIYARLGPSWQYEMQTPILVAASRTPLEAMGILLSDILELPNGIASEVEERESGVMMITFRPIYSQLPNLTTAYQTRGTGTKNAAYFLHTQQMSPAKFKVLIAGGGPVGLTAALALMKANVEFVLLEKHSHIVSEAGSDLVLSPISLRALSQLGLYGKLCAASTPLSTIQRADHEGNDLGKVRIFDYMRENFGEPPRVLRRRDLCKILFDKLSSTDGVLCNKEILEIEETANGVTAICSDNTRYEADMIIGADGVHSRVRAHINKMGMEQATEALAENVSFFKASYICLWMRFPTEGLLVGSTFETHGIGASTQMFVSPDYAVAGIYERLRQPMTKHRKFTQKDEEALIDRWRNLPLCTDRNVTLGRMYDRKIASGLTVLPEGVHATWSSKGRSVLVGDAAHVFTPITGAGCNNGIMDVVVLINKMHSVMSMPTRGTDARELCAAFDAYQSYRFKKVSSECQVASSVAATATWQSTIRRLADQYVISLGWVQSLIARQVAVEISQAPCFQFLPADEHVRGKIPWVSHHSARDERQ